MSGAEDDAELLRAIEDIQRQLRIRVKPEPDAAMPPEAALHSSIESAEASAPGSQDLQFRNSVPNSEFTSDDSSRPAHDEEGVDLISGGAMDVSGIPAREEQQDSFDSPRFTLSDLAEMPVPGAEAMTGAEKAPAQSDTAPQDQAPIMSSANRKTVQKKPTAPTSVSTPVRASPILTTSSSKRPTSHSNVKTDRVSCYDPDLFVAQNNSTGVRHPSVACIQQMERAVRAAGLAAGYTASDVTRHITFNKYVPNLASAANLYILQRVLHSYNIKMYLDSQDEPLKILVEQYEDISRRVYVRPSDVGMVRSISPNPQSSTPCSRPTSPVFSGQCRPKSPDTESRTSSQSRSRAISTIYVVGAAKDVTVAPGSIYREALARKYPSLKSHFHQLDQQELEILEDRRAITPIPASHPHETPSSFPSGSLPAGRPRSSSFASKEGAVIENHSPIHDSPIRQVEDEAEWLSAMAKRISMLKRMIPGE
eukprot:ANDGO_07734.mRNA.1 hypothetical protein